MVQAIDAHACGEPGRVIVGGVLDVPGATMYDKMCYLRDHADGLRKRMLTEPRGYPAANCNLILPSSNPAADAGYVIMEQVEYPGDVGNEYDLRDDRAARDGHAADEGARHRADPRVARGAHRGARGLRERQSEARHLQERPRVRRVSRHERSRCRTSAP